MTTRFVERDGTDLAAHRCLASRPEPGVYRVDACPYLTVTTYTVDFADLEALRGYAAGHQLLGFLDTAYNTDGLTLAVASNAEDDERPSLSDREWSRILVDAGAGPLVKTHQLGRVRELGTDIFGAVKWLLKFQGELCAPRSGYLLNEGICLTGEGFDQADLQKALAITEATLAHAPIEVSNGHGVRTQVRMDLIYEDPVADLNLIAPRTFDARGNANSLPDPSLHGIFVHGDAPKFYELPGQ